MATSSGGLAHGTAALRRRRRSRRAGAINEINMTPFIDVMLVLLIIFMVAASVVDRDDRFRLPPASNARESQKSPLVVKVTREGRLLLGETTMLDAAMLEMVLRERLAGGESAHVLAQQPPAPLVRLARGAGRGGQDDAGEGA